MTQKHDFVIEDQNRVKELSSLLTGLLRELDIEFFGGGGTSKKRTENGRLVEPTYFGEYTLLKRSREVGLYSFMRENSHYPVHLDLSGLMPQEYENLARVLGPKFPEIQFPVYTG